MSTGMKTDRRNESNTHFHHKVHGGKIQVQHIVQMLMIPANATMRMLPDHSVGRNQLQ